MPGFMDVVIEAWNKEVPQHLNHLVVLHVKLSRTTKMLRALSKSMPPHANIAMMICRVVILQLETSL
jgi:hypothetical protein